MADNSTWVFGYASLIWRPDFDFAESRRAVLTGYRRRFCMTSVHYRGTPEVPGLVLALDRDANGSCSGLAYRLPESTADEALAAIRARELVSYAYDEARLSVRLEDGRDVEAIAYVVNRDHAQYRGDLDLPAQAEVIARAIGPMGPNAEYLTNTVASLQALDLSDPELTHLAELVLARSKPHP